MEDKDNKSEVALSPIGETDLAPVELSEDQRNAIKQALNQEANGLLIKLSQETNLEKTNDLTYLFNVNHAKKAMARQTTLDEVMDSMVDNWHDRVVNHPDEMDNDTLLKGMNTIQTIMEKNSMAVNNNPEPKTLIQVNKTENTVNITPEPKEAAPLTTQQRKNIDSFIANALRGAIKATEGESEDVIDADVAEVTDAKNEEQKHEG
jgi:hypothetical protein